MQSPPFERRSTCPYPPQPELIHDNSNTVSDTESPGMDMDMDQDMGGDQNMQGNEQHGREGNGISVGYSFGNAGSGGFGFGPGAEEDEEEMVAAAEYRNGKLLRPSTVIKLIISSTRHIPLPHPPSQSTPLHQSTFRLASERTSFLRPTQIPTTLERALPTNPCSTPRGKCDRNRKSKITSWAQL
jgi:hypothetical protein